LLFRPRPASAAIRSAALRLASKKRREEVLRFFITTRLFV
jgi:hypothetical protein